jgi:hypothetical protein
MLSHDTPKRIVTPFHSLPSRFHHAETPVKQALEVQRINLQRARIHADSGVSAAVIILNAVLLTLRSQPGSYPSFETHSLCCAIHRLSLAACALQTLRVPSPAAAPAVDSLPTMVFGKRTAQRITFLQCGGPIQLNSPLA